MLRNAVSEGSDLGKKAREIMDKGEFVPDDIMVGISIGKIQKLEILNLFWMVFKN